MGFEYNYRYNWGLDPEPSYSASSVSDSAIARSYARMFADRMQQDNLDTIDKNHIAGMIYAIMMRDEIPRRTLDRLVDERPDKKQLFSNEEFEI